MLYSAKILNRKLFSYFGKDPLYLGAVSTDDSEVVDMCGDIQIRFRPVNEQPCIVRADSEANCFQFLPEGVVPNPGCRDEAIEGLFELADKSASLALLESIRLVQIW